MSLNRNRMEFDDSKRSVSQINQQLLYDVSGPYKRRAFALQIFWPDDLYVHLFTDGML